MSDRRIAGDTCAFERQAATPSTACWNCGTAEKACHGDCCGRCDHRIDAERGHGTSPPPPLIKQSLYESLAAEVVVWFLLVVAVATVLVIYMMEGT